MDGIDTFMVSIFVIACCVLLLWIVIANSNDKSREEENGGKDKNVDNTPDLTSWLTAKQAENGGEEKNTDQAPFEPTNTVPPKQTETTCPAETPRKAPVLAIVACCLLGAFILGQLGNTLELTGGRFNASVMGYTIGVLSFAIAALVLMIVDTVKRMR